jgi:5-formaminoimidazole-4-carboxamide-1-(beta)-D-ribofuranosyl 5'-monophosphate synthetase
MLKGAQLEGFRTLAVCQEGRDVPYRRFGVADEIIIVKHFAEMNKPEIQEKLREMNAIIIPHGSFVAYVGLDNIEKDFRVPMMGNRRILRWESERSLERQLLSEAGIKTPSKIEKPEKIDRPVMVKFPGARGGRGYFITDSYEGFKNKFEEMKQRGWVTDEDWEIAHIEEYIVGNNFCIHYFYSPLADEVEVLGMDRRYEANIDGLVRIPARDQIEADLPPSYVVVGNFPIVVRESLLPQIFEMGDRLADAAKKLVPPGLLGAFCIQTMCTDNMEFYAFEISARSDGGTNTFMDSSPYSFLRYGDFMSMGRRIVREVRIANEQDELEKVVT